ncbi:MAG: low temperature requirement protein A [Actinomycetota bacterium]|nr:low temperature requirement protein A [Actinomycetota bacterium]
MLFILASRDDPGLRHSVAGLAASTAIGVTILVAGSHLGGEARLAVWASALAFDMAGPLFIDTSGWRLVAGHFAERHGLIMIVALGESIVAIGVGAEAGVDGGVITAATLAHVADPLPWEMATALAGGTAMYLLAQVAFKRRSLHTFSVGRLVAAVILLALIPLAHEVDALVTVAVIGAVLWALIVFESVHYAAARDQVRHADAP